MRQASENARPNPVADFFFALQKNNELSPACLDLFVEKRRVADKYLTIVSSSSRGCIFFGPAGELRVVMSDNLQGNSINIQIFFSEQRQELLIEKEETSELLKSDSKASEQLLDPVCVGLIHLNNAFESLKEKSMLVESQKRLDFFCNTLQVLSLCLNPIDNES